ncbi:MAG TPA: single-stranded DNA-binding protein [Candidatus Pacebacteria bacterium]|nr:single-stranded DNA-binding protein [Candidatus Paceibacterota bacterium]
MSVRSLNKVMLIGNLTRDPNLRFTPTGTAVCSFGIATNRAWTPSDGGEKQERVDFHNIVSWAKLAEICGQLLHKGDKVYLEGRIQTRDWKTEEGVEKRITEIIIDNMMLLSNGRGGAMGGNDQDGAGEDLGQTAPTPVSATTTRAKTKPAAKTDNEVEVVEDVSDDIPF